MSWAWRGSSWQAPPDHHARQGCRWPADLVDRDFAAQRPNQLWVADLTMWRPGRGCLCGLGHRRLQPLHRGLAGLAVAGHRPGLDALEMAIWHRRGGVDGLVHHSDRGSQYLSIRYTERLAEAGAVTSGALVATRSTTPWPRRSLGCTRPNWSAGAAPGRASTTWSTPPWRGSTGSTTGGSWSPLAMSRQPSSRPHSEERRTWFDSRTRASDKPGAVHFPTHLFVAVPSHC